MSGAPALLKDLGMSKALDDALLKLLAALPTSQRQQAARARERIYVDPSGWSSPDEVLPHLGVISEAVWSDRRLRLLYNRPDGPNVATVERIVDPLGLVAKASIWYLVASRQGELRVYRISRVQSATVLDELARAPPASISRPTGRRPARSSRRACGAMMSSCASPPSSSRAFARATPPTMRSPRATTHRPMRTAGAPCGSSLSRWRWRAPRMGWGAQVEALAPEECAPASPPTPPRPPRSTRRELETQTLGVKMAPCLPIEQIGEGQERAADPPIEPTSEMAATGSWRAEPTQWTSLEAVRACGGGRDKSGSSGAHTARTRRLAGSPATRRATPCLGVGRDRANLPLDRGNGAGATHERLGRDAPDADRKSSDSSALAACPDFW